jgi:hypothetical protein
MMETLPAREMPAVTAALDPVDPGILVITGDNLDNSVQICQSDATDRIIVQGLVGTSWTMTFASAPVHTIRVSLLSGHDQFTYSLLDDLLHDKLLVVDAGDDNDTIGVVTTEVTIRNNLTLRLGERYAANRGNDRVVVLLGDVDNSQVYVDAHLGEGNDEFSARFNSLDPVINTVGDATLSGTALVFLGVHGDAGNDGIYHFGTFGFLTKAGKIQTSLNIESLAELRLDFNGGEGGDLIGVYHRGALQGLMEVDAHGAAGRDRLDGDIEIVDGLTASAGELDLNFFGDQDNDYLGLRVDVVPSVWFTDGEDPFIDGGAGGDTNAGSTANVDQFNMEA